MTTRARKPHQAPEETTTQWVILFVVLSLLVHALIFLAIVLFSLFVPETKLTTPPPDKAVSISLVPPPAPVQPPPKHVFMATNPQANAPHKDTLVESDNDTQLASQSKNSRAPDAVMPDVVSNNQHADSLVNSPNSPSKQQNPAPPGPKQDEQQQQTQPQSQQPPQPKPAPKDAKPTPKPPEQPTPPKPPAPQVRKNQVDPETGLPLLPPINAPTLAPQSTQARPVTKSGAPAPSLLDIADNVQGRAGMSGNPSPEAMATELGKYKALVYRAVGSRWYKKVGDQLQVMPVGMVRIQYTIYSDGTVETKLLEGGNLLILYSVSQNSITEAAPFPPFPPGMIKELNGATSYTDDFSFSVY